MTGAVLDRILANPTAIARSIRIVPSTKGGKPDGFKIFSIRAGSLWARVGLANGDTIQAVNGRRLESVDQALEVYTALRDARSLEIDLERRGAPLRLVLAIKR